MRVRFEERRERQLAGGNPRNSPRASYIFPARDTTNIRARRLERQQRLLLGGEFHPIGARRAVSLPSGREWEGPITPTICLPLPLSSFCGLSVGLLQVRVLRLGLLQDGDVGVGVLPEGKEVLVGSLYCCGSPTFRTNSANRGSERIGSSKKSVFKRIKLESRSR